MRAKGLGEKQSTPNKRANEDACVFEQEEMRPGLKIHAQSLILVWPAAFVPEKSANLSLKKLFLHKNVGILTLVLATIVISSAFMAGHSRSAAPSPCHWTGYHCTIHA